MSELAECLEAADIPGTRAIVLRHEGPAFCAGADLKERAATTGPADSSPMVDVMRRLMDSPRPTIAAVEGAVRAGGIGLMASCDLVVVDRGVSFALTEVRIGVAIAIISVPILRRVPPGKIAAATLTGEPFDAEAARQMGLITHVSGRVRSRVNADRAFQDAAIAPRQCRNPARALRSDPLAKPRDHRALADTANRQVANTDHGC